MPVEELYKLPVEFQIALAAGYMGAWITFLGIERQPRIIDITFRSLIFGLPPISLLRLLPDQELYVIIPSAIAMSVGLGCLWRGLGRRISHKVLAKLGIANDGLANVWTAIIQTPKLQVSQLSVHTKDGRILYQNEHRYENALFGGMNLGSDGSILMVVDEEFIPDQGEENRTGIEDKLHGTRITYIPASEVARVNVRTPTSG